MMPQELSDGQYDHITNADLYRTLTSMQLDLARLVLQQVTAQSLSTDHEIRLRKVETAYQRGIGIATAIASAAGVIAGLIAHAH